MLTLYITIKINRAIGAQTLIVRHAPGSICKWSNYDMLFIGWHNALQILRIKIFSQQLSTCPSWGGQPAFGTSMQLVSGGQMSLIPNHSLYNMILYTRINFQKHTINNIINNIINRQSYWNRGLCNEQANKTSMLPQKKWYDVCLYHGSVCNCPPVGQSDALVGESQLYMYNCLIALVEIISNYRFCILCALPVLPKMKYISCTSTR